MDGWARFRPTGAPKAADGRGGRETRADSAEQCSSSTTPRVCAGWRSAPRHSCSRLISARDVHASWREGRYKDRREGLCPDLRCLHSDGDRSGCGAAWHRLGATRGAEWGELRCIYSSAGRGAIQRRHVASQLARDGGRRYGQRFKGASDPRPEAIRLRGQGRWQAAAAAQLSGVQREYTPCGAYASSVAAQCLHQSSAGPRRQRGQHSFVGCLEYPRLRTRQ